MISKLHTALAAAGATALILSAAGIAQAGAKPPAANSDKAGCFLASTVDGWEKVDDHTVRVDAGPSKRYDLTLISTPPGSLDGEHIVLKASPSGWVCPGNGLGVSVVTGAQAAVVDYPVTKVSVAPTLAEEKAMKEKAKAEGHDGHH